MQTLTPGPEGGLGVWEAEEDTQETLTMSKQGARESLTGTAERKLLPKSFCLSLCLFVVSPAVSNINAGEYLLRRREEAGDPGTGALLKRPLGK